jgi:hypothetical protein
VLKATGRGDDDRLGLAVEDRPVTGEGRLEQDGLDAASGEEAVDYGHDADRDVHIVANLQADLCPVDRVG